MVSGNSGDNGDEDDKTLWDFVTRTISPLNRDDIKTPEDAKKKPSPKVRKKSVPSKPEKISKPAPVQTVKDEASARQVDRRTAQKLDRGQMVIEGRIDLHGCTQVQAHDALIGYLTASHKQGLRTVLVITGKGGRGENAGKPGIIKQLVPRWLSEVPLKEIVLKYSTAKAQDGGEGALYVYLRRKKGS